MYFKEASKSQHIVLTFIMVHWLLLEIRGISDLFIFNPGILGQTNKKQHWTLVWPLFDVFPETPPSVFGLVPSLDVANSMKALFAQHWKGPPEFICRPRWCFPCPLKQLNEEVVWSGQPPNLPLGPQSASTACCPTVKGIKLDLFFLCSGDRRHGSVRKHSSW